MKKGISDVASCPRISTWTRTLLIVRITERKKPPAAAVRGTQREERPCWPVLDLLHIKQLSLSDPFLKINHSGRSKITTHHKVDLTTSKGTERVF